MATTNTTPITWNGFKTYLVVSVTPSKPSGLVKVSWALFGENTADPTGMGAPQTNDCAFIKGYISNGNYIDEKGPGVAVNDNAANYSFLLNEVWDSGSNCTVYTSASCRISAINDTADYLKVTLRNYIEQDYHFPLSSVLHYSDTKVIVVWVKKVPG